MIKGLVSIVLPIYNIKKEYLKKCILSLKDQTYSKIEIIMVNDGSKNRIEETCEELVKIDKRIKYIYQKNAGVSVARNNGIKNAEGEYICFVDPDDWVENTYIETLYYAIKTSKADFAISDCKVCYKNHTVANRFLKQKEGDLQGKEKNKILYQLIGKEICEYYPPEVAAGVPWAKIFSRNFIEENELSFIPGMIRMQDNIFCLYAIEAAKKIHYIPQMTYNYRKEGGSACYKYEPKIIEYFEKYYDETRKFLDIYNKESILYEALRMKELTSFNSYLTQYFFNAKYNGNFKDAKKELKKLLDEDRYREDIKNIEYVLLNKQEKLFVFLLKNKCFGLLKFIIKIRNKYKM